MPAQPVSSRGNAQQHQRQPEVEAQCAPAQQRGVGSLVDREAGRRDDEEAARSARQRRAVVGEREAVVASERDAKGDQPAGDVGRQWRHGPDPDQDDHDDQVQRRCGTADRDEPAHRRAPSGRAGTPPRLHAHTTETRRIALCVDDFGLHAGINRAALQLAAMARATAITCLVGGPAWKTWSPALAGLDSAGIDIGLHLDFTASPLIAASRRALPALVASAYGGALQPGLLRAEISAQLDAFEQALGRAPAFIDGHQHVHQLPAIRQALLDVLDRRRAAPRPWLRQTRCAGAGSEPDLAALPQTWAEGCKPRLIEALGAAALGRLARQRGYAQNQHLLGVYDFSGGRQRYLALLRGWLARAREGDLLMCHPSLPVCSTDAILAARIVEFEVLQGAGFGAALDAAGARLAPMSRLLARGTEL